MKDSLSVFSHFRKSTISLIGLTLISSLRIVLFSPLVKPIISFPSINFFNPFFQTISIASNIFLSNLPLINLPEKIVYLVRG